MTLDKDDKEYLDDRYVKISDCHSEMQSVEEHSAKIDTSLAVLAAKVSTTNKLLAAVAAPILAIAVKLLFGV